MRNRVITLSSGYERHCFTIYQVFIPILEGPKNELIETPPLDLYSSLMAFYVWGDLYRDIPARTRDLGLHGLIQLTTPFNERQAKDT